MKGAALYGNSHLPENGTEMPFEAVLVELKHS
jgi:hypothetical protein